MLNRESRLRQSRDIVRVLKFGRRLPLQHCKLYVQPNKLSKIRAAVIVPKKVDKRAVVRNRNRRRVIEVLRLNIQQCKPGFDILVYIHSDIQNLKPIELTKEILDGLMKIGVIES
ncbi:MAG: ribonuclease P protein component [bacterium]